jgi:ABC-type branched-subunit amino acid transport system substrate-binding protein
VVHVSLTPGDCAALERVAGDVRDAALEAVLIAGLEEPCRRTAQALRAGGVDAVFLGTDALKSSRPLRVAGHPSPWLTNSGTDARRQAPAFHARMVARAGGHHSIYTVEAWEATRLLLEIRARGARTREEMREGLARGLPGDGAPLSFDARGERRDARIGIYVDEDAGLRFVGPAAEVLDL